MNLRPFRHCTAVVALCFYVLCLPAAFAQEKPTHYLPAGRPDALALLTPPPLPGSPEQAADMQEVRTVSRAATSNEVAMAFSEKKFSIFNFTSAIGPSFQPGKFPKTEAFMHNVQGDGEAVADYSKDIWKRPRPFMIDHSLATGTLEKTFSYPSGHSTESMVLALVLADLFPDRHDAIIAKARSIGWHRVEIARHYPTDIYAGRVLAQAIVEQMKLSPDYQRDFAAAQAEIAAAKSN
ncbi:MAG TPA: phosphatase PAP2 family protein [Pseudomonadales bacterium]|nr:phosphatase PAP2 family protein [Pseudomonadales bacterium]